MGKHHSLVWDEREPNRFRQALVRVLDTAAEREVGGEDPEEQQQEEGEDREPGPAFPAPPAEAGGRRLGPGPAVVAPSVAVGASLPRGSRNRGDLALDPTAAIDAIRLLSARSGHSAGYGSHAGGWSCIPSAPQWLIGA